eukprot:gnl/TRDRNA2_/TRDRNA2_37089_c0_seq1.p1 gnl/TRDRNA2_/TRDRNA2_37089_c0~~gnl/TRDRNA2_/TRDRNA2_37089_c0_seq1.p1  ORF type:complete len:417 (+),score=27.49 gnl/TRDRNA2_/TRDRNA2_37089_c0_seq1:85-1335(+)
MTLPSFLFVLVLRFLHGQSGRFFHGTQKRAHSQTHTSVLPHIHMHTHTQKKSNDLIFVYPPDVYEPRFFTILSAPTRPGADYYFLQQVLRSDRRTEDAARAHMFILPCLTETWERTNEALSSERPPPEPAMTSLLETDTYTIDACVDKVIGSRIYNMYGHKKHVWINANWKANFDWLGNPILRNITMGKYERLDAEEAKHCNREKAWSSSGCTFVVPYASDVAYDPKVNERVIYEKWAARPTAVAYRFSKRRYALRCPGAPDASPLRRIAKKFSKLLTQHQLHHTIYPEQVPLRSYEKELFEAKFCLVIRGDTPTTHSLYDALAASCIPIVISDRFQAVGAPFGLNISDFTIKIPEREWSENLALVSEQIISIIKDSTKTARMFQSMQQYRKSLLWSIGDSEVASRALRAAQLCEG